MATNIFKAQQTNYPCEYFSRRLPSSESESNWTTSRCLIGLLQINLALSKQTQSGGWKLKQHFAFPLASISRFNYLLYGPSKTTMNKQRAGKWGLDTDATLGVIIQFVCGSSALTSSQLAGRGCAAGTCWFNWKNREGRRGTGDGRERGGQTI